LTFDPPFAGGIPTGEKPFRMAVVPAYLDPLRLLFPTLLKKFLDEVLFFLPVFSNPFFFILPLSFLRKPPQA